MDDDKLHEFCRMFGIRFTENVDMAILADLPFPNQLYDTATEIVRRESGVKMVISEKQLARLIRMLTNKGYYHDDSYDKRMREEELILSYPELKRMHDEYKMYLYMLCGDEWRDG